MSSNTVNPVRKHRWDVWLKIVAPILLPVIGLVGLCVALVIAAATGTIEPVQVTIVMSVVSTLCLALPISILCLVGCAAMIALAYAGGWGYRHVKIPVRAVRGLTETITAHTNRLAPKIARPTMAINIRVTRLEHSLRSWIAPSEESREKDKDDGSSK
jgi:hypothetical protein